MAPIKPRDTPQPCEAHKFHSPRPKYQELHHVVPQAWQRFWQPSHLSVVGRLFDKRTVALCRTGHGNVHWHLERLMKDVLTEDPLDTRKVYPGRGKEYEIAYLALTRWKEVGGSLQALRTAKQFGGM